MKFFKLLLTTMVFVLACISTSYAAFLVSDPTPASVFQVTINQETEIVVAQPDGSLRFDISPYSGQDIQGTIALGREWLLNGISQEIMEWGTPVPFVLSGGAITGGLSGLKIVRE